MKKAIYKIENNITHKIYIGQSVCPLKRWKRHKSDAIKERDDYPIHRAIRKYGIDNFTFTILEWTEDYNNREIELIKEYNSITPNGYNVAEGGANNIMFGEDHPRNTVSSKDVDLIISDLKQGFKFTDRELARKYNVTDKVIADINHGFTHKKDGEIYPIRVKKGMQKLSEKQVFEIKDLLKNSNLSCSQIGKMYNVSMPAIGSINHGETFYDESIDYPIRTKHKVNQFT